MDNTVTNTLPKLLKQRIVHTRLFGALVIFLFLFNQPAIGGDTLWNFVSTWLGFALVLVCVLGRPFCSLFIGGIKNESLMRDGPFSVVRNPLYVFSFIGVVGIGLQSGVIALLVVLVGAFVLYYPLVVKKEEEFLLAKFGEPYAQYTREVPRWIPNLKLWIESEIIETRPKFVRKTMFDVSVFFLPMIFFHAHAALHNNGILPTWFTIP
jgi:protein-S-isoprenylcysteine O-methyltransferase Ste14